MKSRLVCSLFAIAFCVTQMALAQSVERPRPAGWDRIVPGGRFMDRFEESQPRTASRLSRPMACATTSIAEIYRAN